MRLDEYYGMIGTCVGGDGGDMSLSWRVRVAWIGLDWIESNRHCGMGI